MRAGVRYRTALIGLLLVAVFVLAVILRLKQAQAPMVFDEFASMYFSQHPLSDLWGWWMLRETNPPLFYTILKIWRAIVPESQGALRLLPLLLSLAQIGLLARFVGRTYGPMAAVLCIALFALSPSDIYQSEYVRGYVLAKLAVALSFIGLVSALRESDHPAKGWPVYVGGAVVAIYSHTTMLLWPAIASIAVLVEWGLCRTFTRARFAALAAANLAVAMLSAWVIWFAVNQLHVRSPNISWIEPLSFEDYASSANLQLLLDGTINSALMGLLILVGCLRTFRSRVTRLSLFIVAATLAVFKVADGIHPIVSDYTMHWCANFTVLLAAAALARGRPMTGKGWYRTGPAIAAVTILTVVAEGLVELRDDIWIPEPQDFRYTVRTVAHAPGSTLLVSHESMGVVVTQACRLEFHQAACPFPLVVMQNPSRSDSWAFGGYGRTLVAAQQVSTALPEARPVYVFSRYVYSPLAQLGMQQSRYHDLAWDDGELIGPIPRSDFPVDGRRHQAVSAAAAGHRISRTL